MADGLIIVIRLSCLPSTPSLLSSDLSKCGIVSQNGGSHLLGSSVTLGHGPGAGPQEEERCDSVAAVLCGQGCMDPLPRSPSEGSCGVQGVVLFSHLTDIIFSPPVWLVGGTEKLIWDHVVHTGIPNFFIL